MAKLCLRHRGIMVCCPHRIRREPMVYRADTSSVMNVKLHVEFKGQRSVIPLRKPVSVIGRAHGNAVRIPSPDVSRRHCRLILKDDLVTVEDLESVNGTFLNGRRLKSAQVVRPGDRIEVGPVSFTVEYRLSPSARDRLRSGQDSIEVLDVLEGLADGEVMDAEILPEVELIDEDPLGLDPVEVTEPVQQKRPPSDDLIQPDFDFDAGTWKMPDGGDLRDILSQIEDDQPAEPRPKSKKRDTK